MIRNDDTQKSLIFRLVIHINNLVGGVHLGDGDWDVKSFWTLYPSDGSFLDIGCANGLLLECLSLWANERELNLVPHGIDISPRLIQLARARLPTFATNLAVANALTWQPSCQYDYVHTLLEYVPNSLHLEYLSRLLSQAVAKNGRLIVSSYSSRSKVQPSLNVAAYLHWLGYKFAGSRVSTEADGWVLTHIAWIEKSATMSNTKLF